MPIELELDAKDIADKYDVAVRIKGKTRFSLRCLCAGALLNLADKVLPVELFIITVIEPPPCPAGYACDDIAPYGFVPEDGCPIHDIGESPCQYCGEIDDCECVDRDLPDLSEFKEEELLIHHYATMPAPDVDDPSGQEYEDYKARYPERFKECHKIGDRSASASDKDRPEIAAGLQDVD